MEITNSVYMWMQIKNIIVILCTTFLVWQVSLWGLLLLLALTVVTTKDKEDEKKESDEKRVLLTENDRH